MHCPQTVLTKRFLDLLLRDLVLVYWLLRYIDLYGWSRLLWFYCTVLSPPMPVSLVFAVSVACSGLSGNREKLDLGCRFVPHPAISTPPGVPGAGGRPRSALNRPSSMAGTPFPVCFVVPAEPCIVKTRDGIRSETSTKGESP